MRRITRLATLTAVLLATRAVHAESMSAILKDIEAEQAKLPQSRQDVSAVLAEIGDASPVALHRWVKLNVRSVDYAGSLRDVDGTLADRRGNSLDRSLLLARLLTQSGFEAKVVGADVPSPVDEKTSTGTPLPVPEPDAQDSQAKAIADALVVLAKPATPPAAKSDRHWWVRYNDGKTWQDLDAAMTAAGQKSAEPAGVELKPDAKTQQVVVPPALKHRVALVLNVERWEAGKLVESPCLRTPLDDPKQAALLESRLTFVPYNATANAATTRDDATPAKLKAALLAETAWCPVLIDGPESGRLAKTFDDGGVVRDVPKSMGGAEKMAGSIGQGFGGFGGLGGSETPGEKATVLTAVFADYVISVPGEKPKTVRRPVFDAVGPAQREAAAKGSIDRPKWAEAQKLARGTQLSAVHSTLVARAAVDFDDYVARFGRRVLDARPLLEAVEKGPLDDAKQSKLAEAMRFNSLELFAARRATASDPLLYVAEPQIYRSVIAMTPGEGDELTLSATSDLAHNPLRTFGDAASLVRAGVLDTLRESHVIMADAGGPDHSTAALIDAATKAGATLKLLKSPADASGLDLPSDTAARLRADLSAGQWCAAPSAAVGDAKRFGWWRIDPQTGQTVGVMDTGYLQDYAEWTETHEVNGIQITKFGRLRVGKAAHKWAEHMLYRRGNTSWTQWNHLLRIAQQAINTTGKLPPW